MKKILSLLSICLLSLVTLAGCGVKGSSSTAGIKFVKDVFYVDYNVKTFLEYKVYPATVSNVYVNYELENDLAIDAFFTFSKDGSILVTNNRFSSVKVTAKINEYSDSCQVKLKEYPTYVNFDKTEDYINAGSIYSLDLKGLYGAQTKSCKDRQYVFKVTSSNPSVVEVESEQDLLVRSTGRSGEVKIDVQICDSLNQEKVGLKASIKLIVVDNLKEAFVSLGNAIIKNKDVVKLDASSFDSSKLLGLRVLYINENNFINEFSDCLIYLTNDDVCEIVESQEDLFNCYLKLKDLEPLEAGKYYSVNLIIQSTAVLSDGLPLQIRCELRIYV